VSNTWVAALRKLLCSLVEVKHMENILCNTSIYKYVTVGTFLGPNKIPLLVGFTVVVIAKYDSATQIQSEGPYIASIEAKS
jgi:hypothetical protein